jgi:hypothetical protein
VLWIHPDPLGIALILVGWIRIRIRNLDPDPKGKNSPSKTEKSAEIFYVLKYYMFSFQGWKLQVTPR